MQVAMFSPITLDALAWFLKLVSMTIDVVMQIDTIIIRKVASAAFVEEIVHSHLEALLGWSTGSDPDDQMSPQTMSWC